MLLGTYTPDGRALGYDATTGAFDVGGATVSSDSVRAYADAGQVEWLSEDIRAWFYALPAVAAPVAPPVVAPTVTAAAPAVVAASAAPHVAPPVASGAPGAKPKSKSGRVVIIVIVVIVVLLCGCSLLAAIAIPAFNASKSTGGSSSGAATTGETTSKTAQSDLATKEGVSTAAGQLYDELLKTKPIGEAGGVTGWVAVPVIDGAQKAMTSAREEIRAAQAEFDKAPNSTESVEGSKRLLALSKSIDKSEESLTLTRIVAVSSDSLVQADSGGESAANAVKKANDSDYSGALSSAKDARSKLTEAEKQFAILAAQYPGADFQSDVKYCKAAAAFADTAVELARLGKSGNISGYNKMVGTANKKREALGKITNPIARQNKIYDDSVRVYGEAMAMLEAVSNGNFQ